MIKEHISKKQRESLFTININGQRILGVMHRPLSNCKKKIIIMCGGLNAQRCDINRIGVKFSREMASKGISVIRFDYRGLGVSEGDSWNMTIDSKIEDINGILDYVSNTFTYDQIFLLGFSDGARNIVEICSIRSDITGAVFWNPTLIYNKVDGGSNKPILDKKTKKVLWVLNGNFLGSEFYRSVKKHEENIMRLWEQLSIPIFIIWGEEDITTITTKKNLSEAMTQAPLTEFNIKGAKHLFCRESDHTMLIQETYNWLVNN
jgi:alpha/beta superfamily hydrolase